MTSVDTNVLIRMLVDDDPVQVSAVRSLVDRGPIWIAKTVLLETAWALRSIYGFEPSAIRETLEKLVGMENVQVENHASVMLSLALMADGIDIADAMHLASTPPDASFASFDQVLVRRARRGGLSRVFDPSRS
jgi:predicted nucleic-acid-binding protein